LTQKIYPYVLSGVGVGYISQHTREQSIQLGFTPQVGAGISYFFKKDTALNVEYRYRHFSNAKIKEPNDGINVNMFLVGVSLFY
jgi:opacity protein-like surface antigen